jgi:hypothetical protein
VLSNQELEPRRQYLEECYPNSLQHAEFSLKRSDAYPLRTKVTYCKQCEEKVEAEMEKTAPTAGLVIYLNGPRSWLDPFGDFSGATFVTLCR